MPVLRLPRMNQQEIDSLIENQMLCRIAFRGDEYPYIIPFQYIYLSGSLYFHFTKYGKKMRLLERDQRVCVEIEQYHPDLREYRFVTLRGVLKVVTDPDEKIGAIKKMVEQGEQRLSRNFLAAHGITPSDNWSSLDSDKSAVIVKLDKIVETVALKSP